MSVIREDKSNSTLRQLFMPRIVNETQGQIAAIDLSGWDSGSLIVNMGASGDELGDERFIEIEIQESDVNENEAFRACGDKAVLEPIEGTNTGTIGHFEAIAEQGVSILAAYKGHKRFIRPVIRMTGEHENGTVIGISVLLRGSKYRPVAA